MASKPRLIMVAADNSDFSLFALKYACENIAAREDSITIAHVRPQVEERDFFAAEPYRVEFEEAYLRDSEKLLEMLKKVAESIAPPGVQVTTVSLSGDPSQELDRAAREIKPSLLVVGSHGKGLLKRALLGSVSRFLVHSAPCPVLVVKMPASGHGTAASLIPGMEQLGSIVGSAS